MSSAICFSLDQSKFFSSGKELTHYHTMPHFDALKKYIAVENIVTKG